MSPLLLPVELKARLVDPSGFGPEPAEPKSAVLPLHQGSRCGSFPAVRLSCYCPMCQTSLPLCHRIPKHADHPRAIVAPTYRIYTQKGLRYRQDLNLYGLLTVSVFYTVLNAAPLRILTTYISVYPSATISSLSFQAVSLSRELPYMFVRGSLVYVKHQATHQRRRCFTKDSRAYPSADKRKRLHPRILRLVRYE